LLSLGITTFAVLMFPFLPESPKLLYEIKDYEGCRNALRTIATWNGAELSEEPFIDELEHT